MQALSPANVGTSEVTTTLRRFGIPFSYDPNSYIGRFIWHRGIFEEAVLKSIAGHLKPGMTFIDIGANIGQHTCVAAKLVGPTGRVVSFEPGSVARARLLRNVALNGFRNVQVHDCALGNRDSTAVLHRLDPDNDGHASIAPTTTPGSADEHVVVKTLDSVLEVTGPCVVKIDVEGAEVSVLEGATRLLHEQKPRAIFVECVDAYLKKFGSSGGELFELLTGAGYTVYVLRRGSWHEAQMPCDGDLMARL
jgi:FkbM family methyltransferase